MTDQNKRALEVLDRMLGPGKMVVSTFPPQGPLFHKAGHRPVYGARTGKPLAGAARLVWLVEFLEDTLNAEAWLSIPRTRGDNTTTARAFWVRLEGKDSNKFLGWFKPQPSVIIREGQSSKRTAIWFLREPIRWKGIVRGNERLAYKLRAPRVYADPDGRFSIPAPGCCLRERRKRPVPVRVERLTEETFEPLQVIGHLRDAPEKNTAWRE